MNRILIICNESITVVNFRKELIKFLIERGFEISVVVGDDKYLKQIKELNVGVFYKKYSNRSKNPFSNIAVYRFFKKAIKSYKPDLVFTFQLKPNVYGTAASKREKIPVLNMVEGLGDPFISKSFSMKLVRKIVSCLYRRAFKYSKQVFFLNVDDKEEFVKRKIVDESIVTVINGIGIDTNTYVPSYNLNSEKKVLYLARLLRNKGIIEYCKIARLVRTKRHDILFELYGSESELTRKDIKDYISDGSVFYGGLSNDVNSLIKNCRIFAMTSYREGFPRTILESMALGRSVIAFDCIGVRSAVCDGETGYLIKQGDLEGFANKIIELIDDDEKLIKIGKRAREYCVDVCDSNYINGILFEKIKSNLKKEE